MIQFSSSFLIGDCRFILNKRATRGVVRWQYKKLTTMAFSKPPLNSVIRNIHGCQDYRIRREIILLIGFVPALILLWELSFLITPILTTTRYMRILLAEHGLLIALRRMAELMLRQKNWHLHGMT